MDRYQKYSRAAVSAALFCLIAISAIAVGTARNARGPGWLSHNLDPDYCYLLNAVNFATFHTAGHYDHPGTPVQMIGALAVSVAHLFGNQGRSIERDVCVRPEYFMAGIFGVFFILIFCTLFMAVVCMWATSGNWLAVLPMAGMFIASPSLLVEATGVNPEPILVFAALLLQIALLSAVQNGRDRNRDTLLLAAVIGFGCAVKITFLPLALVPLFLVRGMRSRAVFSAGALGFFIAFTLPIAVHYRHVARWFLNIFFHTGRYGYGAKGVIVLPEYLKSVQQLVLSEPMLVAGICCGIAYLVLIVVRRELQTVGNGKISRIIAGTTAAQVAQLLMVAKHPDHHYLLPGLCVSGFTLACVASQLLANGRIQKKVVIVGASLFGIFLVFNILQVTNGINDLRRKHQDAQIISFEAHKDTSAVTIYYYSASAIPYALSFGNGYANKRYSGLLAELYPKACFYNPWDGSYETFNKKGSLEAIVGKGKPIVFQGFSFNGFHATSGGKKPYSRLMKLSELSGEAVYRLSAEIGVGGE